MAVADGPERDQAWRAGNRMLLPRAAASALRQSVAAPDREPDRRLQARKTPPGARKIRELLIRRLRGEVRCHVVLDRHGLVQRAAGTPAVGGRRAQGLGCAGYKGEFRLSDGRYCYPLTVTDQASRFVLLCEAFDSAREELAFTAFARLVKETRPAKSHPLRERRPLRLAQYPVST
jgi:hypothetical protein